MTAQLREAAGRQVGDPYKLRSFWLAATNVLHPLSQICWFRSATKSASSPRGGAKAASPQRDSYGGRCYRTSTSWGFPSLLFTRSRVKSPYTMDSFRSMSSKLSC